MQRIDPATLAEIIKKLTATGEAPAGQFGASAALSGDGATLIVGARKDDGGAAAANAPAAVESPPIRL